MMQVFYKIFFFMAVYNINLSASETSLFKQNIKDTNQEKIIFIYPHEVTEIRGTGGCLLDTCSSAAKSISSIGITGGIFIAIVGGVLFKFVPDRNWEVPELGDISSQNLGLGLLITGGAVTFTSLLCCLTAPCRCVYRMSCCLCGNDSKD